MTLWQARKTKQQKKPSLRCPSMCNKVSKETFLDPAYKAEEAKEWWIMNSEACQSVVAKERNFTLGSQEQSLDNLV